MGVALESCHASHDQTAFQIIFTLHRPYSVVCNLGQWLNARLYPLNAGVSGVFLTQSSLACFLPTPYCVMRSAKSMCRVLPDLRTKLLPSGSPAAYLLYLILAALSDIVLDVYSNLLCDIYDIHETLIL